MLKFLMLKLVRGLLMGTILAASGWILFCLSVTLLIGSQELVGQVPGFLTKQLPGSLGAVVGGFILLLASRLIEAPIKLV